MAYIFYPAKNRGFTDLGWLKSYHSFSFGNFYDPHLMGFGELRVLNDDIINGGFGFDTHPHRNMEIITVPLRGVLEHSDSAGHHGLIRPGDVQIMSAGTGINHSEKNASPTEPVHLFQIWIHPETPEIAPRYEQKNFPDLLGNNSTHLILSPNGINGSLRIHQQAWMVFAQRDQAHTFVYERHQSANGLYLFMIEGEGNVAEYTLKNRDALGITETAFLSLEIQKSAQFLVIEVPFVKKM